MDPIFPYAGPLMPPAVGVRSSVQRAISADTGRVDPGRGRYEILRYAGPAESSEVLAVTVGPRPDASDNFRASLDTATLHVEWSIGVSRWSSYIDHRGPATVFGIRATELRLAVVRPADLVADVGYMQAGISECPHRPLARWSQQVAPTGLGPLEVPIPAFARRFSLWPPSGAVPLLMWSVGAFGGSTTAGAPVRDVEIPRARVLTLQHNQPEAPPMAVTVIWDLEF